jgi:hypothetical protein
VIKAKYGKYRGTAMHFTSKYVSNVPILYLLKTNSIILSSTKQKAKSATWNSLLHSLLNDDTMMQIFSTYE